MAISISFVAVAAICIDKTNIYWPNRAICIVLTLIRWSMFNTIQIAVHNIAMMCASTHIITPINMSDDPCVTHIVYLVCCPIVDNIMSSLPSIRTVIFEVLLWALLIESPSFNYYSLGRWILLWKGGYASSIGGGVSILQQIFISDRKSNFAYSLCHTKPIFYSIAIINGLILHRTTCHRVSAAIRIGWPIRLPRR